MADSLFSWTKIIIFFKKTLFSFFAGYFILCEFQEICHQVELPIVRVISCLDSIYSSIFGLTFISVQPFGDEGLSLDIKMIEERLTQTIKATQVSYMKPMW